MLAAKKMALAEENLIKALPDLQVMQMNPGADPKATKEAMRQKAWADYKSKMEDIQNGYESNIIATGGSVAPREPAATEPPAAKAAPQALPPPVPGKTVVNGYQYVGGNPNDKASWVPVK